MTAAKSEKAKYAEKTRLAELAKQRLAPGKSAKVYTVRPCMCCGRDFRSEGIHNRLCGSCR